MEKLIWETAEEIDMKLAGSINRFETTGQISLLSLTKLAIALNEVDEIRNLFTDVPYRSIQEVINEGK